MTETSPRARRILIERLHDQRHALQRRQRLSGLTDAELTELRRIEGRIDELDAPQIAAEDAMHRQRMSALDELQRKVDAALGGKG